MTPTQPRRRKWKFFGYLLLVLIACYLLLWIFARSEAVAILYIFLIIGVYIQILLEALIMSVLPAS
ncbi:MAG: hypothetical protein ACPHY6_01925 [Candidatus Puniceispirillaceae bacterium]